MSKRKETSGTPTVPATKSPKRRSRKHAYRGYGSGFAKGTDSYGGAIHVGSGFAGVGSFDILARTVTTRRGEK